MKPINQVIFALLLIVMGSANAADIRAVNWTVQNQKQLNGSTDLKRQSNDLLTQLLPNADLVPVYVGEAVFVDIEGNGKLELVATGDLSGRSFFNNVFVVTKKNGKYSWTSVHGYVFSGSLLERLVDVDGDGRLELVLENYIDRYEGAMRVPLETLIYSWQKDHFVENSNAFPFYYRDHVVPKLEQSWKKLATHPTASTSTRPHDDYDEFVAKKELDRAKLRAGMK